MLKLLETTVYENYKMDCYAADFIVGDVHVEGINVFTWDDGNVEVHVAHNTDYVYGDNAFAAAISEAVGFAVMFTEAGMQDEGFASMEAA